MPALVNEVWLCGECPGLEAGPTRRFVDLEALREGLARHRPLAVILDLPSAAEACAQLRSRHSPGDLTVWVWRTDDRLGALRSGANEAWERPPDPAEIEARLPWLAQRPTHDGLRLIAGNLPKMVVYQFCRDPDGSSRFLYVSDSIERVSGVSAEDVLRDPRVLQDQLLPELGQAFEQAEIRSREALSDFEVEVPMRRPDGEIRTMHLHSRPRREPSGRIVWDGVYADITEEHRARAALAASEERLRLAMAAGGGETWEIDLKTGVAVWSPGHYALFGYPEDPSGRAHYDMWASRVHPDDWPLVQQRNDAARESREPFRFEHRIVRATDGREFWLSQAGRYLYDADGNAVRCIGVFFDVTERKRAEEALREADDRKNEFLAMLAHELRNPLAPIRYAAHLLGKLAGEAPGIEPVRAIIERQVAHLVRLVDDLLDVARVSRGKITLRDEAVDLRDVAREAIEATHPLFSARQHRIHVALPEAPIVVRGDPTRLVQIAANLLSNAAKYTDVGGDVFLDVIQPAEIRVRDTGRGIDPSALPKLFDLFFQAERTYDRADGGLGIGLSLVRTLVDLHGGSVTAHSAGRGHGSEFVVRLPEARAHAA